MEIRRRDEGEERVVTSMEVLSLSNKTPGDRGRELYRQKQDEVLASRTHLVEIDLLRAGVHTTAVPLAWLQAEVGNCDYHVCIHRYDRFADYVVYPVQLQDSLPEIAIPLLPEDGDVLVDLQAVFEHCYTRGPYPRKVRYSREALQPPLSPAQWSWVQALLSSAAGQP